MNTTKFQAVTKFFGSVCCEYATRKECSAYCKRMGMQRSEYTIKEVK